MKTFKQFLEEAARVKIAPGGGGSWVSRAGPENEKAKTVNHPTEKTVGNEPFKDKEYFRRPKIKKYENKMRKDISKGKSLPPVLGTPHPENSDVMSVVDGNHRRQAAKNARAANIPVEKVSHSNVRLLHPKDAASENDPRKKAGIPLRAFRDKKTGKYDMDRPRKKLGGKTLRDYFVNSDGSHNYESPK